jgi:hypothetical protein
MRKNCAVIVANGADGVLLLLQGRLVGNKIEEAGLAATPRQPKAEPGAAQGEVMPVFRYNPRIESTDKAVWCLAGAERRYQGKRRFNDGFPCIVDELGISHTDDVLRAIGTAIWHEQFSTTDLIVH